MRTGLVKIINPGKLLSCIEIRCLKRLCENTQPGLFYNNARLAEIASHGCLNLSNKALLATLRDFVSLPRAMPRAIML